MTLPSKPTDMIAATLGLTPMNKTVIIDQLTQQVTPVELTENPVIADILQAHDNIADLIEIGRNAVDELATLASASQDPKIYDALSKTIKTMLEANHEKIELHRTQRDLVGNTAPKSVHNHLHITTAELQKLITGSRE
jgi:uncharacterized protein involved in exopolysaccharide biosynthesis